MEGIRRLALRSSVIFLCLICTTARAQSSRSETVARVNGVEITEADLEFELMSNNLRGNQPAHVKRRKLDHLIEKELVLQHLKKMGIEPDRKFIDGQITRVKAIAKDAGVDERTLLQRGFNDKRLRDFFASWAMFRQYMSTQITKEVLQKHFEANKSRFDGTEVRAAQIYLTVSTNAKDADLKETRQKLLDIRQQIVQKQISFADAARKWSHSSSSEDGGDIGFSRYDGPNSISIMSQAFSLKQGEVSQPFQTPFGMHLITVLEIRPGQFVLEDVRPQVYQQLEIQAWNKLISDLKPKANIEYLKYADKE